MHRQIAALPEHEDKYRILVEYIPAITYIAAWDEHSSTLYTSPQIETMLGFSQAEWMADPMLWLKQIHPDDRTYVLAELARIRADGTPVPCEYRMFTHDGQVVWFRDDVAIGREEYGRPLFLYGVMLDITERKQLEAALESAGLRLAQAQEARRLELAQELEDAVVCHLTTLGDRLTSMHRAAHAANGQEAPVITMLATELDAVCCQVFDLITDLHKRIKGLQGVGQRSLRLTVRELAVLRFLVAGKNNSEIAQGLGISRKTVEKHVGNMYAKLGINSRAEAAAWAVREGLI
jgi:PAS domain S-box-containing protein